MSFHSVPTYSEEELRRQFVKLSLLVQTDSAETECGDRPNEEGMMAHILECLWVLFQIQRKGAASSRTKLFYAALVTIGRMVLEHEEQDEETPRTSLDFVDFSGSKPIQNLNADKLRSHVLSEASNRCDLSHLALYRWSLCEQANQEDDAVQICDLIYKSRCRYSILGEQEYGKNSPCASHMLLCHEESEWTVPTLKALYDLCPWAIYAEDSSGLLALHIALKHGRSSAVIQFLLESYPGALQHPAKLDGSFWGPTQRLYPIHFLCRVNCNTYPPERLPTLEMFLRKDPSVAYQQDGLGETALHYLCRYDGDHADPKAVNILLTHAPDASLMPSNGGALPIDFVCGTAPTRFPSFPTLWIFDRQPSESLIRALLGKEGKAATISDSEGRFLLHRIAAKSFFDFKSVFLPVYEANPAAATAVAPGYGMPLHQAVKGGNSAAIAFLLSHSPPEARAVIDSKTGWTLLHFAAASSICCSSPFIREICAFNPLWARLKGTMNELPIHLLLRSWHPLPCPFRSNLVRAVDNLQLLLRVYPESVIVPDPKHPEKLKPYDYFVRTAKFNLENLHIGEDFNALIERCLLRALPCKLRSATMSKRLRTLNYEARRGALYVLFAADISVSATAYGSSASNRDGMGGTSYIITQSFAAPFCWLTGKRQISSLKIWHLLRHNQLLRHIVSFL